MKLPMFYTFPVIRGIQAGREYYVSMCPLRLVPRLLVFDEEDLEPNLRSQRVLNKARIPVLAKYMIDNPNGYVFSAITVSIDGDVEFHPISDDLNYYNLGTIRVPMDAKFIVNDGQHRRAGIEAALKERPELGNETIAIVFFIDRGLKRCQQMFADLNRHAVRPTESLNILYDHRDPIAEIARSLTHQVPVFEGLTELERSTISNRSTKLFTLSGIYRATCELLTAIGDEEDLEDQHKLAYNYWNTISRYLREWNLAKEGRVRASELRRDYINVHTIALVALGRLGASLVQQHPDEWTNMICRIGSVDWHRSNPRWEGRVTIGGRISYSRNNLVLLTNELKHIMGVELSNEELEAEAAHKKGLSIAGRISH
ncbi:DNA sulfur modification protein DndB [Kyrpidia spormannii]|uniref:DNA sulfur modification protein DndB n=1 Tax=Kyrpidia spormannii TaxID=2055160 RepID=UPI0018E41EE0|nr:DNA sulfur modification protein DndB [Kyrpidia spormannii]